MTRYDRFIILFTENDDIIIYSKRLQRMYFAIKE